MGGSFNTREFFHGKSRAFLRRTREIFFVLAFPVPLVLAPAVHAPPLADAGRQPGLLRQDGRGQPD